MLLTRDRDPPGQVVRRADRGHPRARPAAHGRAVPRDGLAPRPVARRRAQHGDRGRGAVRPGAEPHQRARRPDHADQQRPHDPRPPDRGASLAVPAREVSPAAVHAGRLVHPGRPRHLEPAPGPVSRPLRDDEGHERAAAELRPRGVARRAGADRRGGHGRRAAARAHGRHHERRRAAVLRPVPRPRRRGGGAAAPARPAPLPRPDRPAGHRRRPQGAQHRPQGPARPRRRGPRRLHRLGAGPRRLLHGRARHGRSARSTTRSTTPPA